MAQTLDIDVLRAWIGRSETATEILTATLAERFHATIGLSGEPPKDGDAAPRMIHLCLGQPSAPMSSLGRDGHPALGGFLPPVPLPRRMWAGGDITFTGDLRVGQTVTRQSTVVGVVLKEGRTGQLCFVEVLHEMLADGAVAVREKQTIVYREADVKVSLQVERAPQGEMVKAVEPTSTLLFRYSALTFNGHRIHYDEPFATKIEGYPGLVFHGPLQATLLFHFAATARGGIQPDRLQFRSVGTLFDKQAVLLHGGTLSGGELALWSSHPDGPSAMRAQATWS